MTIDWTLLAPITAAIAAVRSILRSRRQYEAEEIDRRYVLVNAGGVLGTVGGSLVFAVGHAWLAALMVGLLLPEAVVPERLYPRWEAWYMRHLVPRKARLHWEWFQEERAAAREAELEFKRRMEAPIELPPGHSQGNDP